VAPGEGLLLTPLHAWHQSYGGRLVEFGGWSMPVQYRSIVEEHQAVRKRVGLFDISHMGRLTFDGPGAVGWLERVTTNRVTSLADGRIQYSLIANDQGGVIDDILVYRQPLGYLVVCNAANRARVVKQFRMHQNGANVSLRDRTLDTAMIAVQGPWAAEALQPLFDQPLRDLHYYRVTMGRLLERVDTVISRTGYTGEDGYEVIVAAPAALAIWLALLESGRRYGIIPCGLGARDTLRLEAGMPLYGHELTEYVDPFEAGLGWAVKLDKGDFVGRDHLQQLEQQRKRARVGLALEEKRIARQGASVLLDEREVGLVTSGTFSPTLEQSIAMALVSAEASAIGTQLTVDVRGHRQSGRVVALPFYRRAVAARVMK
jgi:aminomethyltransferase